jgi:sulfite reductase (ferredoxin)
MAENPPKLSHVEQVKGESRHLRGNLSAELDDASTEFVSDDSYELLKFHGSYQGFDRDTATQRKKAGLEKIWEFMVRLKMPAGRLTAKQYLVLDELAGKYANGTLRLTTRQTFQFHCIAKRNMKAKIKAINEILLSTLGGCGDIVRNLMAAPAPYKDHKTERLLADTNLLAAHCAPKTTAYHEIWVGDENVAETPKEDVEPLYGKHYMPRKFKIALAIPEDNTVDLFTHDLGFILVYEGDALQGYNVYVGGGLGMTHNKEETYPRLASPLAFVKADELIAATEAVIKLQRDYGDRSNRKHARLKYVVEEKGPEWTRKTFEEYFGKKADDVRPIPAIQIPDHMGWHAQGDGKWFLGIPISSGRIEDREHEKIRTGLREVIREYGMNLVLTPDQNIILADIEPKDKDAIAAKLRSFGIKLKEDMTRVDRNMLACVALPTCGKALSEAERIRIPFLAEVEKLMQKHGILEENLSIRIAGCPNGCSRPFAGEIGIVGRAPDLYAIYAGGDFEGTRLSDKLFDKVPYVDVPAVMDALFADYVAGRKLQENYGTFSHRVGTATVLLGAKKRLAPIYKWAA